MDLESLQSGSEKPMKKMEKPENGAANVGILPPVEWKVEPAAPVGP